MYLSFSCELSLVSLLGASQLTAERFHMASRLLASSRPFEHLSSGKVIISLHLWENDIKLFSLVLFIYLFLEVTDGTYDDCSIIVVLYHGKTLFDFWCKRDLNSYYLFDNNRF